MDTPTPNALDGTWQLVRAELDGEAAHELVTTNTVLEFAGGRYSVHFDGALADHGTLELGGTLGLKLLVLRGLEGPNAGRTIPALFQRVGDRLRICYGLDGVAPTMFATAAGQRRYLATYRRK